MKVKIGEAEQVEKSPGRGVGDGNTEGKHQAHRQAREIDEVGKEPYAKIGDHENDNQAGKNQPFKGKKADVVFVISEDEDQPCGEFDERVHRRDGQAAVTAFAAQNQPAEDGNVVVRLDRIEAAWAPGAWRNDGDAFRNARDANIQEAADDDAEEKKEERDHSFDFATDREEAQRGVDGAWRMANGWGRFAMMY